MGRQRRLVAAVTAAESGPADCPVPGPEATAASRAGYEQEAARALSALYTAHYRPLVQLAALLVGDLATAEEVVQDSFIAVHAHWRRLHDTGKASTYLRACVINRSRSVLRHRRVVDQHRPPQPAPAPSAEESAVELFERSVVVAAVRRLPPRQRQALVLRYYADFSEAQIASAMGITRGAVKSHLFKAISGLRAMMAGRHDPRPS